MANADLLKQLFRSYKVRDDDAFLSAAMGIVAEEKRKNHNLLARDLQKILSNGTTEQSSLYAQNFGQLPRDKERNTVLVDIRAPKKHLSDLIISEHLKEQFLTILEEFHSGEILKSYGLEPKRKLLFSGPPGCGKTLSAEIFASELGLPLLYTRFDAVISSYLGETSANLRKVFDYASTGRWVVFFDEFDAIGKSREDMGEHGELKRVVNTFLQLLDNFHSESIFIAATNHEQLLDKALWRRFDEILYFGRPDEKQIIELISIKLRGFRHKQVNIEKFAVLMAGWSHASVERVCIEAVKIAILQQKDELTNTIFKIALERQDARIQIRKQLSD